MQVRATANWNRHDMNSILYNLFDEYVLRDNNKVLS
jgi:hypothetical protein